MHTQESTFQSPPKRHRARTVTVVAGVALVTLLGTAYAVLDFGVQYHLVRLRLSPDYLTEIATAPEGSAGARAVDAHVQTPEGKQNLVRQYVRLVIGLLGDATLTEPTALDLDRWKEVVVRLHPLNEAGAEREWWARFHSQSHDGAQAGGRTRCTEQVNALYRRLSVDEEIELRLAEYPGFKFRVFHGRIWNTRDGKMNYWRTRKPAGGSTLCVAERDVAGLE